MMSPSPAPDSFLAAGQHPPRTPARFVILWHELPVAAAAEAAAARASHYDLMLEDGPHLRTWALDAAPAAERIVQAIELAAHRLAYLEYEGPVSGGRGVVSRWDSGLFTWLRQDAVRIQLQLAGQRISGNWQLTFDKPSQRWSFGIFRDDSANR